MVSISMSPVVSEYTKSEHARKRSADLAYTRHAEFAGGNESKRNEVAQQLSSAPSSIEPSETRTFEKLGAGQLKHVALPLGETLEETIASWRDVRREALSETDPTETDRQLAAAASAKIMEAEAQLALEDRLRSVELSRATQEARTTETPRAEISFADEMKHLFEAATEAYAFQTDAKQRGYEVIQPSFSQSA